MLGLSLFPRVRLGFKEKLQTARNKMHIKETRMESTQI